MLPYLQIIFCALLWGLAGPLIKWSGLPSLSIIAIRFWVPLVLTYAWIRWVEREKLQPMDRSLANISALTLIGNTLYIVAFSFTSISNVLLLLYTRPVLTTLFASALLHEHISRRLWGLLLLSCVGAITIISAHEISFLNSDIVGMGIALLTALITGFSWALIKKRSHGVHTPSQILFHQHLFGGVLGGILLPYIIYHEPAVGVSIALFYGLVVGFFGSMLHFRALRSVPLSKIMPLTYTELLVAITCGTWFFGDVLSLRVIIGGMLILLGAVGTLSLNCNASGK